MADSDDTQITTLVSTVQHGSIVAAAGCGKTELIARATQLGQGCRLILTHTHAGVDVLRARLDTLRIRSDRFRVDTIAGWCLRFAAAYPKRSGLLSAYPANAQWNEVYAAAVNLLQSGSITSVLHASYSGIFVDEYQDCTMLQHEVIKALAEYLPVCVFGDPLQAIFDFKNQRPVDWDNDVFPVFLKSGELTTPWRWRNAGNSELADWLTDVRAGLINNSAIDLRKSPRCVAWHPLPSDTQARIRTIVSTCKTLLTELAAHQIVVIADPANLSVRARLAQQLAETGFSNIEPLGCKDLASVAASLDTTIGTKRLEIILDFLSACMTKTEKTEFLRSVDAHRTGKKRGTAKFGNLVLAGMAVEQSAAVKPLLDLMNGFRAKSGTRLFRKEMFYALQAALRLVSTQNHTSISEAVVDVQNSARHVGRNISKRSVGSTLLVKGLEFDHAVIIHSANLSNKGWYVALTRATKGITVLSPTPVIAPSS